MNAEERRKRKAEQETYFASIAHLKDYFDLKRVRHFTLSAEATAKVDALLSRYDIPIEAPYKILTPTGENWHTPADFKKDIHWIFGYIGIQYTLDFKKDQKAWKAERQFYRKPETKDGVWQYVTFGQGHIKAGDIEKITVTYKDSRKRSTVIAYPYLIDFIIQAIEDKYRHKPDNDDELGLKNQIHDDFWNIEKYTEHKWGTKDYLTFRKKETIEEIYYYLHHNTQLGTQALCKFGAELMFIADVPFMQYDGSRHDVFNKDLIQYFKKYAPIQKRRQKSDQPSKLEQFKNKYKSPENQEEL